MAGGPGTWAGLKLSERCGRMVGSSAAPGSATVSKEPHRDRHPRPPRCVHRGRCACRGVAEHHTDCRVTRGDPRRLPAREHPRTVLNLARVRALPTTAGINAALEQVFFDLNVGDDPAFADAPRAAVLQYRADGHRSLSVGDVVELFDRRYVVDRCGFRPI